MKASSLLLGLGLLVCPAKDIYADSSSSSSSFESLQSTSASEGEVIGNFRMLGLGRKNSVVLSNNIYYRPTRKEGAKLVRSWQIDDEIRVLEVKPKHKARYVLLNRRTGESIKTKIYKWK